MPINYDDIETKVTQRVLVDNQSGTLVPFIRSYVYDDCGDLESVNDTDFDGEDYTVIGTVEERSNKVDFVDEIKVNERLKIDVVGSLNLASTNACVYMNQLTEQVDIDQNGEVLNIDNTTINTNPAVIDTTTNVGEYEILVSGNFEFDLKVTADTQDNARRTSRTVLERLNPSTSMWEELPSNLGSTAAYGYHRNNASGENTSSSKIILAVAANSRFRYTIKTVNNGLIKTVPEGISLSVKQI